MDTSGDYSVFNPTLVRAESWTSEMGINDSITNFSILTSAIANLSTALASYAWDTASSLWGRLSSLSSEAPADDNDEQAASGEQQELLSHQKDEKVKRKLYNIANELQKTEETYVYRLGILVKIKARIGEVIQPDIAKKMFQNIEVIHEFHKDNLLPLLQQRLQNWEADPRLGDIMRKLVPFLKLYTEYVMNFETANVLVETWKQKNSAFAALVRETENTPEYGKIKLQGHMLEPVQRVPRYELLLRDFLKTLPENHVDRPDTEKALKLVAEAASHFEESMRRDSRVLQLIRLQSQIEGPINIIDCSRDLILTGRVKQVQQGGKTSDRFLHLFSDLLLISKEVYSIIPGAAGRYRVKYFFKLVESQVCCGNNLEVPHTFYVKGPEVIVELSASNADEKLKWETSIVKQIVESQEHANSPSSAAVDGPTPEGTGDHLVQADGQNVLKSGFLNFSSDGGKSFKKRWFVLTDNLTLASYKSQTDSKSISYISLRGFQMSLGTVSSRKKKLWILVGEQKTYHLQSAEGEDLTESWCRTAKKIVDLEHCEADKILEAFSPAQWKSMEDNPRRSTISTDSGIEAENVSSS